LLLTILNKFSLYGLRKRGHHCCKTNKTEFTRHPLYLPPQFPSPKHRVNSHKSEIIVLFIFSGETARIWCIATNTHDVYTTLLLLLFIILYFIICDCVPRAKTPLPLRKSAESHAPETARPDDMGCDCTWNNIRELLQHLCESYTYIPKYYMCACVCIGMYWYALWETSRPSE